MKYGKRYKEVMAKGEKAKEKLYSDTRKKGVRFYDKKGSGYMKGGVKKYDWLYRIDPILVSNHVSIISSSICEKDCKRCSC